MNLRSAGNLALLFIYCLIKEGAIITYYQVNNLNMTEELKAKITKAEVARAQLNKNNPKESNYYEYYTDLISKYKEMLPKPKFKLHMAPEEACESCQ